MTTPAGFKEAYAQFVEAGWGTLMADAEYGGQGLPYVIGMVMQEYPVEHQHGVFGMYPGLNDGAQAAIEAVGSA